MPPITSAIVRCGAFCLLTLAGCVTYPRLLPSAPRASVPLSLEGARVIYIGEKHDEEYHHRFQQSVICRLHRERIPLTVGMEMIAVNQQPALDHYLAKRISWSEFSRRTRFDREWGRTSPAYRQILSFCRKQAIPVLGLNAPAQVARKLARGEPLTAEERRFIPRFPEPPEGFAKFRTAMVGHGRQNSLRCYYEAQRAWDQTMAGRILDWLRDHAGILVVLLGDFHADPVTGVPWYVAQRSSARQIIIRFHTKSPGQ